VQEAVASTGLATIDAQDAQFALAVWVEGAQYNVPFACAIWVYLVAVY